MLIITRLSALSLAALVFALFTVGAPVALAQRSGGRVQRVAEANLGTPASTIYGYNTGNRHLVSFSTSSPGTFLLDVAISGLGPSEAILGMDFRPGTSELFGLAGNTTQSRVVRINLGSGALTTVGEPFSPALPINGPSYGMDFDPATGLIRVVNTSDINLRLSPSTGQIVGTDTPLAYLPPDADLRVGHAGYDAAGTLYGIDGTRVALVRIGGVAGSPPADSGQATFIGNLGVTMEGFFGGFDIVGSGAGAVAYGTMSRTNNGEFFVSPLYRIDLATGSATLLGLIGPCPTCTVLDGFAVLPPPTASGVRVAGRVITADGRGIRRAVVTITDVSGASRRVQTASRGEYHFADVRSGETYTISVESRRFTFVPRVISVTDELTGLDFVAGR